MKQRYICDYCRKILDDDRVIRIASGTFCFGCFKMYLEGVINETGTTTM